MAGVRLPRSRFVIALTVGAFSGVAIPARADIGEVKVYSPLVETGVLEFEYRGADTVDSNPAKNAAQAQKFSVGYGLTDWWFAEAYANWARDPGGKTRFDGTEWESIFQFTQAGEFWANLGLLVEYERVANRKTDSDSLTIGPLIEHDFGPTTTDLNLMFGRQLGPDITQRGIGFSYRLETRWRLLPQFQPAVEAFGDLGSLAEFGPVSAQQHLLGPAATGRFSLGALPGNLQYDAGYLFGLTPASPKGTIKLILEYELPL